MIEIILLSQASEFQNLTNQNYYQWRSIASRDPFGNSRPATLQSASSLFGNNYKVLTRRPGMIHVQWEESDRSIKAWFKSSTSSSWELVKWSARGF